MPRPPRLPDTTILELVHELRHQHAVLTGTRLREELLRRHGMRGGVSRIYRLLDQATASRPVTPPSPPPSTPTADSELRTELAAALDRARLAEYREETHQARWAGEIHQLREQVQALKEAAHRLPLLEQEVQDRSRELAAAYRRLADLEDELRQRS